MNWMLAARRGGTPIGVSRTGLRSVKPHSSDSVGGKELKSARALRRKTSQGDKLKLRGRSASKAERYEGDESGQNRDHPGVGMARGNCGFPDVNFG
jgi:hypothetical protein